MSLTRKFDGCVESMYNKAETEAEGEILEDLLDM